MISTLTNPLLPNSLSWKSIAIAWCLHVFSALANADDSLWNHLTSPDQFAEMRGMSAEFENVGDRRLLQATLPKINLPTGETQRQAPRGIGWISLPPPEAGWNLTRSRHVRAKVRNTGLKPAETTLWVVSSHGWAAVGGAATLEPNQTATLECDLRQTYPDGTPRIDPSKISEIRIMVQRTDSANLEISNLVAAGTANPWVRPSGRMDVPDMELREPVAGKRVRYQLPGDPESEIYSVLYLPPNWKPGNLYPVIAEFPGNLFFNARACWSTGRPEQCQMGYGITSGRDAIWISLPFVDQPNGTIAESGFGSNRGQDTVSHTRKMMDHILSQWGGDRENVYLCGFSRGSIACGYIGLANEEIAELWKGIIGCQHYDGSNWRESNMEDAVLRAPRFRGQAIFQVDNSQEKYQPVVDATNPSVDWTWVPSKLGYHATAMFLDDRPAMVTLRQWFQDLNRN
ncbi:MAG: hypothetical protein AAGH89_00230 [Verrucomicrobiota bacterium]